MTADLDTLMKIIGEQQVMIIMLRDKLKESERGHRSGTSGSPPPTSTQAAS